MAGTGNGKATVTDEIRATLRGKMNVEIAAMVANGEIDAQVAGQFLLERATVKATRKGLIGTPTAA